MITPVNPNSVNFNDKTERVTHLASKNQIHAQTCDTIFYKIERRGDFEFPWGFADDEFTYTIRISPITT